MSQQELLKRVIHVLNELEIEYMLTGSFASSLFGEPRLTHDIDIVLSLHPAAIPGLLAAFAPPRFYLNEASVQEAIRTGSMFMLLDTLEGDKVDFWMLTDSPFDQSRFRRRIQVDFEGETLMVSTPEDTILAKLQWAKLSGGSEKQVGDARGVYETEYAALDMEYLEEWVDRLAVRALWEEMRRSAEGSGGGDGEDEIA